MKRTISLATALLVSLGITACSGGGSSTPSVTQPAVKQPEVKQPEVKQPEVKQPEVKQPEVKQPEVKQPEVKQPEVKQPEAKQPEAKQPEAKQPEAKQSDAQNKPQSLYEASKKLEEAIKTGAGDKIAQAMTDFIDAHPSVQRQKELANKTKENESKQPETKQPETKQPVVIMAEGKSLPHIPRKSTDDEERHSELGITEDHYFYHITDFSGQEKDGKVYRLPVMTKDKVKIGDYYFVNQAYSTYGLFRASEYKGDDLPTGSNAGVGDKYPNYYQGQPTAYTADLVQAGGTATYHGYAIHRPEIGSPEYNVGNFKLDVDFKDKTVMGYISDVKDLENFSFKGNIKDYSKTEKMVGFDGKSQDGWFRGGFMGSNAEEVVGGGIHKDKNIVFGGKR